MAYTTINKSSEHFDTKLYSGTGSAQDITGLDFQPDWNWIKRRNTTGSHRIQDAVRGSTKYLASNSTDNEVDAGDVDAFLSNGFSLDGSATAYNASGSTYASWNWKANGAGSANTDGSISSTVSANTTAGFSIVSYTGTNATGTVGHGLGVAPKIVLYKNRTDVTYWYFTTSIIDGSHDLLLLPATDAQQPFSASLPTSSVLNLIANNDTNGSGDNIIAYCFAEKTGYSKFGSYTGNGNADGAFVYTGFKPAFVIVKQSNTARNWLMFDNKRNEFNIVDKFLIPNTSGAEQTSGFIDFTSNGFKFRTTDAGVNENGGSFIYMAFAAAPLVGTNNVPANAR